MQSLKSILQLSDPKRLRLFLEILVSIPLIQVLLISTKMPGLLSRLDHPSRKRRSFETTDLEEAKLGWKYANFFIINCLKAKRPCLLRSLILFNLFRKKGLDSQIHFGIKRKVVPLEGHSWISFDGGRYLDQSDPELTYIRVYSYPDERRRSQPSDQND